jgi:membrane associated rhomboid family serine protease
MSAGSLLWLIILANVVVMLISDGFANDDGETGSSWFKLSFISRWGFKLSDLSDQLPFMSSSIFTSMFVHVDWAHLCSNMVGLYICGFQAFSGYHSLGNAMPWFLFALLYFGSGLCGCLAEYTVFNRVNSHHVLAKQASASSVSSSWSCTPDSYLCFSAHYLADFSANYLVDAFAGLYAGTLHAKDTVALIVRKGRPAVGASGCVYGVNSFSLVLFCWNLLYCRGASSLSLGSPFAVVKSCVKALWIFSEISSCFEEIQFLGVGLKEYTNTLWGGDNVGHAAHGGGAAFGVAFAVMCCIHSWKGLRSPCQAQQKLRTL